MRTVRDADGRRYLLVKRSSDASTVRDPKTGEERYVRNDQLFAVEGESPLETAARAVPESVRATLTAVPDDRALGLLVELVERGPMSARQLLDAYDLCERDLHGLLAEFQAGDLVDETTVHGERGYELTDEAVDFVESLIPS